MQYIFAVIYETLSSFQGSNKHPFAYIENGLLDQLSHSYTVRGRERKRQRKREKRGKKIKRKRERKSYLDPEYSAGQPGVVLVDLLREQPGHPV